MFEPLIFSLIEPTLLYQIADIVEKAIDIAGIVNFISIGF